MAETTAHTPTHTCHFRALGIDCWDEDCETCMDCFVWPCGPIGRPSGTGDTLHRVKAVLTESPIAMGVLNGYAVTGP